MAEGSGGSAGKIRQRCREANCGVTCMDINYISIIAEIGVAIATGVLAYITYLSVKSSKSTLEALKIQVEIARKEFENKQIELEKPQIIDQLREVLNPLYIKVDGELNQIEEKSLLWKSQAFGKPSQFFQLKPSAEFYFEAEITSRRGLKILEISITFPTFRDLCQKRYNIHISISDLFKKIYQEINTPDFDAKIGELIYKKNQSHDVFTDQGICIDYVITLSDFDEYGAPAKYYDISVNIFQKTIVNMRIAELLGQRVISRDDTEQLIISEYYSYRTDLEVLLKPETFDKYSKSFHSLIEELKTLDIQLRNDITKIKMEYREKYHLSDNEYWAIFQNTS